jgi:hypothetical protein
MLPHSPVFFTRDDIHDTYSAMRARGDALGQWPVG